MTSSKVISLIFPGGGVEKQKECRYTVRIPYVIILWWFRQLRRYLFYGLDSTYMNKPQFINTSHIKSSPVSPLPLRPHDEHLDPHTWRGQSASAACEWPAQCRSRSRSRTLRLAVDKQREEYQKECEKASFSHKNLAKFEDIRYPVINQNRMFSLFSRLGAFTGSLMSKVFFTKILIFFKTEILKNNVQKQAFKV